MMESRLLAAIAFLSVTVVIASHAAALSPEIYWSRVLPNTPMPKAVKHSLLPPAGSPATANLGPKGVVVSNDPRGKRVYVVVQPGQPSPFSYGYAATETQLHDNPNTALFFLEKDLSAGTKMNINFTRSTNRAFFLPRQIAESIPFSSQKLSAILTEFSVRPGSEEAKSIEETIRECEEKGVKGEDKYCATSLESMVDYVVSKTGYDVDTISTEVDKESREGKYVVSENRKMTGENVVVCHKQNYAYAVFYCHRTETKTRAYVVSLMDMVGGRKVMAAAVCHTDTSAWNPKHLAFQVLKVKPGTVPICHFLPEDHIVWVAK